MSILFISDLHLEAARPDITRLFCQFLQNASAKAEALYILGDFFEAYIGDDDDAPFLKEIKLALHAETQKGFPIFIMHGNRDFLIGKKFLRQTGCQLLPEEAVVKINGVPTLLMHGDTLCTSDVAYLRFRKKARNWFFQQFILWKSLATRRKIAEDMRQKSKAYTATAPEHIMDVTQEEVERVMRKHHVLHLIHGHTHRPQVHTFSLDNQLATRTVLGAWHDAGSVLNCDKNGEQTLQVLALKSPINSL